MLLTAENVFEQIGQLCLVVVVLAVSCEFSEFRFLRLLRLLEEVLMAVEGWLVVVGVVLVSVSAGTLVAGGCPLQAPRQSQSPFSRGFLWHTTMCAVLLVETRKIAFAVTACFA